MLTGKRTSGTRSWRPVSDAAYGLARAIPARSPAQAAVLAGVLVACASGTASTGADAGSDSSPTSDSPGPAEDSAGPAEDSPGPAEDSPVAPIGQAGDASMAFDTSMHAACTLTENDAGTRSALDAVGPMVMATCSQSEPPQPQGGTVEDGTYTLQTFTYYGVCPTSPDLASTTWSICGDQWDVAQLVPLLSTDPDAGTAPVFRLNFATAVQGTSVSFQLSCVPTSAAPIVLAPRGYTASPGHLTFIYPDPSVAGRILVSNYARQ